MTTDESSTRLAVVNPATGASVGDVPVADPRSVEAILQRSADAQRQWARTARHERHAIMLAFSALVSQRAESLAQLLSAESGKPLDQTRAEVAVCARLFRGFAERMVALTEEATFLDAQAGLEGDLIITRHEPLGVVVAIIPFNFPVELFAHKVAPAIAMGNSVVVKPPVEDPLAMLEVASMLTEAGLPEGVVQVVAGGREIGQQLVASTIPAAISLTGSTETGLSVAQSAAKTLKRVSLELGSNDPMIVLEDADLGLAVENAVFGRQFANGQCCCANKRILVSERVATSFTEALVDRFGSLTVGDPAEEKTELGPLISETAAARVADQVGQTVSAGATAAVGGERSHGQFFEPTVLTDVTPDMDIATDMEVFGPVLPVLVFGDDREAVDIANSSRYGLSGSVFSADQARATRLATMLETGQVVINGTGLYRPDVAGFGGYKYSGNGREGLSTSLEEYSRHKDIALPGFAPAHTGSTHGDPT